MACDITKGRAINCKDQIGGLKAAWIMGFGNLGTVTLGSSDEATDASGTGTFFQYDLKGSGNTMEISIQGGGGGGGAELDVTASLFI